MGNEEVGCDTDSSLGLSRQHTRPVSQLKKIYSHPVTQVTLLGFVCFLTVGSFNGLMGLGAAGQADSTISDNALTVVYVAFAITAFFAGPITNILGARLTLFIGSMGYALHIGAYLAMNIHPSASTFVVVTGAILGMCAAFSWTAQGALMLAYPTEEQKGRFVSIFWSIYNLGGVVGASIPLSANFHSKANSISRETYIAFLVMACGAILLPFLMANPQKMSRTDGSKITMNSQTSIKAELLGFFQAIKADPCILVLFPMFLASNWYYTWQMNDYNGARFDIRARSLNNLIYWVVQIVSSAFVGWLLDIRGVCRRTRALTSWALLLTMVIAIHVWAYFYQREYTRGSVLTIKVGIQDPAYVGSAVFYASCAFTGAAWQIITYWILGALSNDPRKLAYFTGLHNSVQSVGAAIVWRLDAVKVPFMSMLLSTWIILILGLVLAFPVLYWRITDQTDLYESEDYHG